MTDERPKPNHENVRRVLGFHANGQTVDSIANDPANADWCPKAGSVRTYILNNADLDVEHARASELFSHAIAGQIVDIADVEPDPNRARVRVDVRKWLASKANAKAYGDKIDLTVTETVDLTVSLDLAKSRLDALPMRDHVQTIDAEVIDTKEETQSTASDTGSADTDESAPGAPDLLPDFLR